MELFFACLRAFLVGGAFCAIAQLLLDLTALTPARILVIYVCAGVALGGLGLYEPLRDFAGSGASLPLVGFGGNVALGVREAVEREGLLGAIGGGLAAASVGSSAALCFGWLGALLFKTKHRRA